MSIQTACSTSLVSIHTACQNLLNGECDMALAGGVTINIPHLRGYLHQEGEIMASDGHCRAFDSAADGTIFGSGVGVVVLRRLSDALESGDCVRAIIKGSAINNDGAMKAGYLAPSVDGQAHAVAEALAIAGVDARSISYVEAHGTGTAVGDPIELEALTQAFRESTQDSGYCLIGSTKPNIGHLDTAAGVASFIKVVEALRHGTIPPSLNYESPNPRIDFESSPFRVNSELLPWDSETGPRRAGVNSLGVGGTNAHVILEEAPVARSSSESRSIQVLPLSARTKTALENAASRLADALEDADSDMDLADVAYTLKVGRKEFEHRKAIVCRDRNDAISLLRKGDPKRVVAGESKSTGSSLAFMFPGGGAQYPQMGRDLYESESVFREHVDRGLSALAKHVDFDIRCLLFAESLDWEGVLKDFERPSIQLPTIFIIEVALAELWRSWGVEPKALIGHSMGENTAACLAGVLSFEDALGLVALRGRLFEQLPEGGMASVALPAEELEPLLGPDLALGVINSPALCVASGPVQALERLRAELEERQVEHHHVKISIAAHSYMLDPILDEFGDYLRGVELKPPEIPIVSNFTGTWMKPEEATDPEYWVRHLRSTIRFADGIGTLLEDPNRVLLEVGPGKILSSIARQHPKARIGIPAFSSLRHPDEKVNDLEFVLGVLGRLWTEGIPIDWHGFYDQETRLRVPLPTYPFEHQPYWIEPGQATFEAAPSEEAIQKIAPVDKWFSQPIWRNTSIPAPVKAENSRWLIFLDQAGLGSELKRQLLAAGNEVITVREGDAFYRFSSDEYALAPEAGREGYDALIKDLSEHDQIPENIAHLWTISTSDAARPGSSPFHHYQERGFYSLFFLAQAIGDQGGDNPMDIMVVSNGMQSIADEGIKHPEKATLLGPVQVIPRELPGLRTKSVDIVLPHPRMPAKHGPSMTMPELAEHLLREQASSDHQEQLVAWRGRDRFIQALQDTPRTAPNSTESIIRADGVYLITGGLGGLGLAVAKHLATRGCRGVILIGRSPMPPRNEWDHWLEIHSSEDRTSQRIEDIRSLEKTGTEVMLASGDVANLERMEAVVSEAKAKFSRIHGVFHTAGILEDGIIQAKSPEAVERVFTPKVQGSMVLSELLKSEDLDFMLLFSSTSTMLGPAGQVDYVAANTFLNALAESHRCHNGMRIRAVNWGVWQDTGMALSLAREMQEESPVRGDCLTASHPLLRDRIVDNENSSLARTCLRAENTWLLNEHRLRSGLAIMPGTGYLELIRASYTAHVEQEGCEVANLEFLSPLEFPGGEEREIAVEMHADGDDLTVTVKGRDPAASRSWTQHARGKVRPLSSEPASRLSLEAIYERCSVHREEASGEALSSPQECFLSFGPRWKALRKIAYGQIEAIACIELSPDFSADLDSYKLHPALMDLATGYAMPLLEGFEEGQSLFVPLGYQHVRIHADLVSRIHSYVRVHPSTKTGGETATFDITITDDDGRVLVEVDSFTIRRLGKRQGFGVANGARPDAIESEENTPAERTFLESLAAGITVEEGMDALDRILCHDFPAVSVVSSIPIETLRQRQDQAIAAMKAAPGLKFSRPDLGNEFREPRNPIEHELAAWWQDLLGIDTIGIDDDFFQLGGHSLIAVRLFAKIKSKWNVEYPLSVLFEAPTIALCAELLRSDLGEVDSTQDSRSKSLGRKYNYLVPMNEVRDSEKPPFFLVSGMFGNVLNLRHLASHLGDDQPVYAIQARGLYGEEAPHRRFDEMARAYLEEVRQVQPKGPYLLGGFSGGGITAFEMAHQLLAAKDEVAALIMLDTPIAEVPKAGWPDRIRIQFQRLWQQGPTYLFSWAKNRIAWELQKRRKQANGLTAEITPAEFRSEQIEAAFIEALANYSMRPYPGKIILFRPPLPRDYKISGNRY
ncbi:MAG: SDR family NAD(P)-dependent oxidoreductase, partial [Planctomycetota bacterium]